MMTEPNFAPSDKITYCYTSGPTESLKTLHRAWAPAGNRWLTCCDSEEYGLSLPADVTPDSKAFVICRKACFPPRPSSTGHNTS